MANVTARLTLKQASQTALAAAEAGDLDALQRALDARGAAIAAGDTPQPEDYADGERVFTLLNALVREVSLEMSRLRQIEAGFAYGTADVPRMEVRG